MKYFIFTLFLMMLLISFSSMSQEKPTRAIIDNVTYDWDKEAKVLRTYEGLRLLCGDPSYRKRIFSLLNEIHHYDTLLFSVLTELSQNKSNHEIKKTLKEIEKFEKNYDSNKFLKFLGQECKASKKLEDEYTESRNAVAENSYSGQVYVLEAELFKYVQHVTHCVDKIRTHVHHLIIDK